MTRKLNFTKPGTDEQGVKQILEGLYAAQWTVDYVDQGDGEKVHPADMMETIEAIFEVDEAVVYVYEVNNPDVRSFLYFVLGNDPEEVLCDHGVTLSSVIDPITNGWWE